MNGDGRVNIADYALFRSEYGRSDCSSAAVYFYHTDHLGTPRKMTDSTGAVVWAADYQPFGRADLLVNTVENNLRFPGQYFDAETG
ncbi:RHS domain-containing protein, partial [Desulfobulbus elongatus]|uniref:RHS domain-containing protein n=1 Tax=Desulfobulbus elongatus TaxID=53332 RepID=UPI000556DA59